MVDRAVQRRRRQRRHRTASSRSVDPWLATPRREGVRQPSRRQRSLQRDSGIAGAELLVVDVRMRNRFLRQRRMGF